MTRQLQQIQEWRNVDLETFRNEIVPQDKPAVLRGAVERWPSVHAGLRSAHAMCDYLKGFDSGRPIEFLVGPASIGGRFFYQEDMERFNFERVMSPVSDGLDRILTQLDAAEPTALFVQSAPVPYCLPDFARDNVLDLVDPSAPPRIWIGNSVIVATHFDLSYNIACVVAGRRRFTLFPPDQLANLYVGPMENTPAGTPISLVSLEEPDFERYPRFAQALDVAQEAELGPGDAIYIPFCWWHHVHSLAKFNVLVNYWWNDAQSWVRQPYGVLVHAMLGLRDLPPDQRAAWREMFDYYVFQMHGEALGHLPPEQRGSMAPLTPERVKQLTQMLRQALVP